MQQPPSHDDTPVRPQGSIPAALTSLGRALAGALGPEDVVRLAAEALHDLLAPDCLAIVVPDPDGGPAVAAAGEPDPDDLALTTLVMAEGPLLVSTDVARDLAVRNITLANPPASWLGVPLLATDPIGAVSLGARVPGRFAQHDLDLVTAVASQTTLALEKSRLLSMLSDGKREWERTADAIGQGICVVDGTGTIRRGNRAFSTLVDVPLTDIAGRPWLALLPPTWADTIKTLLTDPDPEVTCELRAGDRQFAISVLPLTGSADRAAVLIFDDQTERRRLQDQLIQSEKMSAIGQLIAGVAHDLNNPLASVVGFADYLVEAGRAPDDLVEPLRAIHQEAERAANIVKNLLTFARKQEHQRRVLPIREILSSTLLLLKNQLMASKVEATLDLARDLPDVDVDANQIQQVFVNLINNAAQAIESGGTGGRITISAVPWLDGVAVTVADDGPGVSAELAEQVFEPFFTTKREGEGTGLGLSICQGIVKEHGGRLTLATAGAGGAAFRVELPAGTAPAAAEEAATGETGALRVLVVDDEPHIQHYMRATLEEWGHSVVVASNGVEGLATATRDPFDVIISDLRMPELGGREMYDRLQRDRPAAAQRVVFSTGDTVRGDTLSFLESLGRPYLRKPFALAELRAVLAATVAPPA